MTNSFTTIKPDGEILRVTPEGEFIWADNADDLIENGDFTANPSLQHILRALRRADKLEPVAIRHSFDGYGWHYMDNGSGSNWFERGMKLPHAEPVYGGQ